MSNLVDNIGYATSGILYFFKTERNGRIQAVIALIVIAAGLYFHIATVEWCIILGAIALIISLEMVNTAIERVCGMLSKEYHPLVKIIKDVAAGAVWWAALFAALIGALIFIPHISRLIR